MLEFNINHLILPPDLNHFRLKKKTFDMHLIERCMSKVFFFKRLFDTEMGIFFYNIYIRLMSKLTVRYDKKFHSFVPEYLWYQSVV